MSWRAQSSKVVELACGVAAADHRADRGADDHIRNDAVFVQDAQHADMGEAARRAAAQRKPDLGPARRRLLLAAHRVGLAVVIPGRRTIFKHQGRLLAWP